jgi:hypothetical protein
MNNHRHADHGCNRCSSTMIRMVPSLGRYASTQSAAGAATPDVLLLCNASASRIWQRKPHNRAWLCLDDRTKSTSCGSISCDVQRSNVAFRQTARPRWRHVRLSCSPCAGCGRIVLSPGSSQPRFLVFAWSLLGCIIVVPFFPPHGTRSAGKEQIHVKTRGQGGG